MALHDSVIKTIREGVPGLSTCAAYPKIGKTLKLPAVLVEMAEWDEDAEQPSDGRLQVVTRWEARCVIDGTLADAQQAVRRLAMAVALSLHRAIAPAASEIKLPVAFRAAPDGFVPELDGHEVWTVEWEITARMGLGFWAPNRIPATTITLT